MLGGDRDAAEVILADYLESGTRLVAEIGAAFRARELDVLRQRAHTLKGASGNVGTTEVRDLSTRLEEAVVAGSLSQAAFLCSELELGFASACEEISSRWVAR